MINEGKLFSAVSTGKASKTFANVLKTGSVSDADIRHRIEVYEKVFSNYTYFKEKYKAFSSYVESDLLSNQYFNATVAGLAKSMAGFLTIERDMDQPTALLWYLDLLGIAGNEVLPNLGPDHTAGYGNQARFSQNLVAGTTAYNINLAKQVLPGSFKMTLVVAGVSYQVTDDKSGNLIAPAGVLSVGTINYNTGAVVFTLVTAPVAGDSLVLTAAENQTGTQGINRFTTNLASVNVTAYPELLVGETNLASLAAMRKSLGVEVQDVIISKLTELYTKMVNQKIVNQLMYNQQGNVTIIDLDNSAFHDYRSILDSFTAQLVNVDQDLALKSYKGVKATAYVCAPSVVNMFRKLRTLGTFVDAPQSYINDLVGYFNGIPVLEHTDLPADTGIAVHKTIDGNLAPVIRGIYLPLTNTPAIGNYQNPTQLATGVFYQEVNQSIFPQLQQTFKLSNVPLGA